MEGYGSRFITAVFGLAQSKLHYWDQQSVVSPSIRPAAGRGSRRLYSFRDLVALRTVTELRRRGVSLQRVGRCVRYLRRAFPDLDSPLSELAFVTDGEGIFIRTDTPERAVDALRQGQFVWSVPVGAWAQEVRESIRRHTSPETDSTTVRGCVYSFTAQQDPEDGWWIGFVPALPGCGTQARTREELREMIEDAILCYLDAQGQGEADAHAGEATKAAAG